MSRSLARFALAGLCFVVSGCGSGTASGGHSARPAATVNGRPISMADYDTQVTILREKSTMTGQGIDPCSLGPAYAALCNQLKQNALNALISQELVSQYARMHHITVSDADFRRQWAIIMKDKFHNDNAVLRAYAKTVRVTVGQLQTFARQDLLRQAVEGQVTKNMSHYAPAIRMSRIVAGNTRELKSVQTLLKSGRSFDQVARLLAQNLRSACGRQRGCGELGWLPDAFVPPTYQSVISARDGSVLGPFSGQGGYAYIRIEAHDPHHLLNLNQELAMRERLFGRWLANQESHASVRRYVAI